MFSVGDLARASGCSVQSVRHYEQSGLLPPAARSGGNQRRYGDIHRRRLDFIRHARELGFPLASIRALLALGDRPDTPCDAADRIAGAHLAAVDSKIARLQALRGELQRMVGECRQGRIAECRVIEVLADHSHGHCLCAAHDGASEAAVAARGRPRRRRARAL